MEKFNYELHININQRAYYEVLSKYFECLNKRISFSKNTINIVLFFKSINDICEYLKIDFEKAKKHFISGTYFYYTKCNRKLKVKILPNEMHCLIDYIDENSEMVYNDYGISLDQPNRNDYIERFLGYSTGSINQFLDTHREKYKKLLKEKGICKTYYENESTNSYKCMSNNYEKYIKPTTKKAAYDSGYNTYIQAKRTN